MRNSAKHQWIYAWLLLSPAMIFLITFTHYPAVQTVISSFFSTARGRRKSVFIGWDNYTNLMADEVFWKVLTNNFWYAVWTIPLSIILSLAMALWVNDKLRGRSFLRMSYFTPTVLPCGITPRSTPDPTLTLQGTLTTPRRWSARATLLSPIPIPTAPPPPAST